VQEQIITLYGDGAPEYTAKEKTKIDKHTKLKTKQAKAAAQAAGGAKSDRKKNKEEKAVPASTDVPYLAPKEGEKKDCARPLPKSYNPLEVEDSWYKWWMKEGFFKPEYMDTGEPDQERFTMVIPPPNVTGSLHLGHALTNAIEDSITRWHRMSGRVALWNPGCDHAGIATQSVVEKKLMRETGQNRLDLGREPFLKKVWEWKEVNGGRIYEQLQGLGASLDWDREEFTMSPKCYKAVQAAFIQMHEGGLIKRSDRLINWSCQLQSAISDIEVDHLDIPGRTLISVPGYTEQVEVGVMISFAYKLKDGSGEIVVATTRIETMLGDVAVAVSKGDPRYAKLVGSKLVHPFIPGRELIIIEDTMVDQNLGTGAVKITPSHDPKDYECGKRHNLPFITMLTKDGRISEGMGEFSGMLRYDARKAIVAKLTEIGHYHGTVDNPMVLKQCSRSKDIIEPMKIPQWFCETKEMAADAVKAVAEGDLKLIPERHVSTWNHFLGDGRDWCISRQLWWGHRIPAYFITVEGQAAGNDADNKYWVSAATDEEALVKAAARFEVDPSKIKLRQDDDVLDTWFSSGIYPISIFGWPDKTPDMEKYFPGHLLETGKCCVCVCSFSFVAVASVGAAAFCVASFVSTRLPS
jgi:valyl-tRNA synthetase